MAIDNILLQKPRKSILFSIIFLVFAMSGFAVPSDPPGMIAILWFIFGLPFFITVIGCVIASERALNKAVETLPGFREFYNLAKKEINTEKRRQAMSSALSIAGAGIGGFASGVGEGIRRDINQQIHGPTAGHLITEVQNMKKRL